MEWSEISPLPLTRNDAHRWEPKIITIKPEKVKTRKQTSRARKIHVTTSVARILRAIESLEGRSDRFVFPHILGRGADARGFIDPVAGEPWSSGSIASIKLRKLREAAIEERAKKVAEIPSSQFLAGLESVGPTKLVAYANRHAYASEGSSLGFSDEQIAEQLGNTPNVFRRVYAHTVDDAAARRAQQIAEGRRSGVRRSESRG